MPVAVVRDDHEFRIPPKKRRAIREASPALRVFHTVSPTMQTPRALVRLALALGALSLGAWLVPRAEAERPSVEVRLNHLTASYRWSTELTSAPDGYQDEGFHFAFGGGVRVFPDESGHGVLVEVEHRLDPDIDGIFDEYSSAGSAPVTVAHLGYARRFITPLHQRRRFALTTTLNVSLALGVMDQSDWGQPRVTLMGVRLGLDVDIHMRRFFFGWTLQGEVLQHFDGNASAFVTHNFHPLMRVGFMFGRQVQVPYPSERPTDLFDLTARGAPTDSDTTRW